jgi:hypothetical protein
MPNYIHDKIAYEYQADEVLHMDLSCCGSHRGQMLSLSLENEMGNYSWPGFCFFFCFGGFCDGKYGEVLPRVEDMGNGEGREGGFLLSSPPSL